MMAIHGWNKLTLLDYPGKLACTLFLGNCNFRCPFCQNGTLVLHPMQEPVIEMEEIRNLLKKRKGILDGVCISGGEPTLCEQLPVLAQELKSLGYAVKLDTNGSRPEMLKSLVKDQLLDYVAMDIKNSPQRYQETVGEVLLDFSAVLESVDFLKTGIIDYEFRTTVVKELHREEDFRKIGAWLAGSKRYFLQGYQESEHVICPGFSAYSRSKLESFRKILLQTIPQVEIRGV